MTHSEEKNELLKTMTEWARQVAAREDVPRGIRSAAACLADDGRRLLAKATATTEACTSLVAGAPEPEPPPLVLFWRR